jgi:predicted patatin/cPLA2 family phospholipase
MSIEQTVSVMQERWLARSEPGYRNDPYKIGLVLAGGLLRGAYSVGMVQYLSEQGYLPSIDAIYGASVGSIIGAYFLGRQPEAVSLLYKLAKDRKFIDPLRALQGKPILDVKYATHKVMKDDVPLRWDRIVDNPIAFHVYATNALNNEIVDFHNFKTQEEILNAIHWSCRVPLVAGMPDKISNTMHLTDGVIATGGGLSVNEAIADGCTHLLVLHTLPKGTLNTELSLFELLGHFIMKKEYPVLAQALLNIEVRHSEMLHNLEYAQRCPDEFDVSIQSVQVKKNTTIISPFERDLKKLAKGPPAGYEAMASHFKNLRPRE